MDEWRIGMKNMINANNFFLLLSLLVLGVFFAAWLLRRAKRRRARIWPSEQGQVLSANVVLKSDGGQPGSAAYYAQLEYSYTVHGQTYLGRLRRRFILKGRADKWIESFARNGVLTVRYNPQKAQDSVLLESDRTGDVSASSIMLAALLCTTCTAALAQAAGAVEPGTCYVFCSANGTRGALVWDLPITLKPGAGNTITLTATNAELMR
jgi:hypothetical protein